MLLNVSSRQVLPIQDFSETLQLYCKFRYCHKMSSVICLSVTLVYCDKTAEVRIMHFSLECSSRTYSLLAKFAAKIRRMSSRSGVQIMVGSFKFVKLYLGNSAR